MKITEFSIRNPLVVSGLAVALCLFGLFAYFPFSKFSHLMYRTAAMTFSRQIGRVKA